MTQQPTYAKCHFCGAVINDQPWIMLNRWGIGTGQNRLLAQEHAENGHYFWSINPNPAVQDLASGRILCWPLCAQQYIEMRMAEVDVVIRQREGELE